MPESPAGRDLFQDSTMTFGQHLEELRICLFRAIIGLVIGCCAGFLVGDTSRGLHQEPRGKRPAVLL